MAYFTPTYLAYNVVGNKREDYVGCVADATDGEVKSRLRVIEEAHVQTISWDGTTSSAGDQAMELYLNTTDTTEGTTPGSIHLATLTGTEPLLIRFVGK